MTAQAPTKGPLTGVRVVEAASFLSGPYATMTLADLGAEVIKVEPPTGDPFRKFGRPQTYVSTQFANCNRGKRSVVLDLKQAGDVEQLLSLLKTADVWLSNWRPQVADRLGLGDATLAAANPRLIRVYVSGYGPTGPLVEDPVFDTIVQARSGMTQGLSPTDDPVLLPGYPVDKLTATMAAQAILAALFARERSGEGDRLDVSMLDAAGYLNFVDLFTSRVFVDHQPADPRNRHGSAVRPVRAKDGWLIAAPVSSDHIRNACTAVGHPEWGPEVLAERDQIKMVHDLFDRMETVTVTETVETWLERFRDHDVPAAPCLGIDEHLADPQVVHNGLYTIDESPSGPARGARYPAVFASTGPLTGQGAAPVLGADTEAILNEL